MPKKILLVEDEGDISKSIKMIIDGMSYKTKIATNGKDAIKYLKKESFDLVLLDMIMPGMAGSEVAEWIRSNPKLKNQKIAFLTVIQLSEAGKEIIGKLKPVTYFEKPLNVFEFRKKLKKILG